LVRDARCNTRNDVSHVIVAARRMVNGILAAARRSAFQRRDFVVGVWLLVENRVNANFPEYG
jgi:hypothetical protein